MNQLLAKTLARTVAVGAATVAGFAGSVTTAHAAPAGINDGYPPITCPTSTSCVLDFIGNGGNGYWAARQASGSTWVRLSLVPGWTTSNIAPITCRYEDSCVRSYYSRDGYWMLRPDAGTTWVRVTRIQVD